MSHRIAVIGTGYLGTAHACGLAELGYDVVGVDLDDEKVAALGRGVPPFFEPGLDELLRHHTCSGRLRFTTSLAEAAEFAEVFFVCVGTPQSPDGWSADTSAVEHVVEQLVPQLRHSATIVGKSTVPVGTAARLAARARHLAPSGVQVELAWNPEFLREGRAVEDTLRPARLVLGVASAEAEKLLRDIYAPLLDAGVPLVVTDVPTAELVKAAANGFLATKISYINAIAELCEAAGADVVALAGALGLDDRIGPGGLTPGVGFGGGCLPKDVRALMARAGELGVDRVVTLLWQVDGINTHLRRQLADIAAEESGGTVAGRRVAVLGAAFKPFTDDVRDSPALDVAEQLRLRGALVRVFDPRANRNAARAFPALGYAASVEDAVTDADLVMHLTEWPEFSALDPVRLRSLVARPRLVDGRNRLDPDRWRAAGWAYRALGRRTQSTPVQDSLTARALQAARAEGRALA